MVCVFCVQQENSILTRTFYLAVNKTGIHFLQTASSNSLTPAQVRFPHCSFTLSGFHTLAQQAFHLAVVTLRFPCRDCHCHCRIDACVFIQSCLQTPFASYNFGQIVSCTPEPESLTLTARGQYNPIEKNTFRTYFVSPCLLGRRFKLRLRLRPRRKPSVSAASYQFIQFLST